jgi:Icc-related predicted phosphoesterase
MATAWQVSNDFVFSKVRESAQRPKRGLTPADTEYYHSLTREFFAAQFSKSFSGVTIVMTHHAPSIRSLPQSDQCEPWAPCYASALDNLIEECQPELWCHGHVHVSNDYKIGKTRIVSNPRGYAPTELNPEFDPRLVIDIS